MPENILSPASPLANLFFAGDQKSILVLVTGPRGAGKTGWCLSLAERARARGLIVAGLVSPPIFTGGGKTGIDLLDLDSGERRRLATLPQAAVTGPRTDTWQFNAATLDWGNAVLRRIETCELLILDELGPLEFKRGAGLQAGLQLVDESVLPLIYVVVRRALLPLALQRWPHGQVLELSQTRSAEAIVKTTT